MKKIKHIFAVALTVMLGGAALCGNAMPARGDTYCDDGIELLADLSSVTIEYENRDEDMFRMVLRHPYYASTPYVAACACVAGSNVIGFYDRYDENLIPDHEAGYYFSGQYLYSIEDSAVTAVTRQLYADMGTNNSGTTVTEFKDGMRTYCTRKGKSISFSSCMKNGQFDYETAKNYMRANQPVVLFCSGYNVVDSFLSEKSENIDYYESGANHVMVGFGYKIVDYTLSTGAALHYEYVTVASGVDGKPKGFYDINRNTKINDAIAINIY